MIVRSVNIVVQISSWSNPVDPTPYATLHSEPVSGHLRLAAVVPRLGMT
jgi:hypothetical protein